jgi:hypothetical protein
MKKLITNITDLEKRIARGYDEQRGMRVALVAFRESQPELTAEIYWRPSPLVPRAEPDVSPPNNEESCFKLASDNRKPTREHFCK